MSPNEAEGLVRSWLTSERMEIREQKDDRAQMHLLVKYPLGKNGHMFAIVIPKGRDLVAVSSMTRVDGGQQNAMRDMMKSDEDDGRRGRTSVECNSFHQVLIGAYIWAIQGRKDQVHFKHSTLVSQFGLTA